MQTLSLIDILTVIGILVFMIAQGFYPIYHNPEKIQESYSKKYQLDRRSNKRKIHKDRRINKSLFPMYRTSNEFKQGFTRHTIGHCICFTLTLSIVLEVLQKGLSK